MKAIIQSILVACFLMAAVLVNAQSKTTTIIVLRHAEKDTSTSLPEMMQADPPLSEAGMARAKNLITALSGYTPTAIFSTNYTRTKSTVEPLSAKLGLTIQFYDPSNQKVLVDKIKTMQGQTIVVVGHSNTAPRLVNLLAGSSYPDLADSVFDQLYIVTIKDDITTVEVKKY